MSLKTTFPILCDFFPFPRPPSPFSVSLSQTRFVTGEGKIGNCHRFPVRVGDVDH